MCAAYACSLEASVLMRFAIVISPFLFSYVFELSRSCAGWVWVELEGGTAWPWLPFGSGVAFFRQSLSSLLIIQSDIMLAYMMNSESADRTEVQQRRGSLNLREKSDEEENVCGEQHDEGRTPLQVLDDAGGPRRDLNVLSVESLEHDRDDAEDLPVRLEPTVKASTMETQTRATPSE